MKSLYSTSFNNIIVIILIYLIENSLLSIVKQSKSEKPYTIMNLTENLDFIMNFTYFSSSIFNSNTYIIKSNSCVLVNIKSSYKKNNYTHNSSFLISEQYMLFDISILSLNNSSIQIYDGDYLKNNTTYGLLSCESLISQNLSYCIQYNNQSYSKISHRSKLNNGVVNIEACNLYNNNNTYGELSIKSEFNDRCLYKHKENCNENPECKLLKCIYKGISQYKNESLFKNSTSFCLPTEVYNIYEDICINHIENINNIYKSNIIKVIREVNENEINDSYTISLILNITNIEKAKNLHRFLKINENHTKESSLFTLKTKVFLLIIIYFIIIVLSFSLYYRVRLKLKGVLSFQKFNFVPQFLFPRDRILSVIK